MRAVILSVSLLLSTAGLASAQASIAGDWEGTLKSGSVELRLALHVAQDTGGPLSATLDNIDQGGFHIPVTSIALTGLAVTLRIDALRASFDGTLSPDGTTIVGTWTQRAAVPLLFTRAPKRAEVTPSDIDGTWAGTLDAGVARLRVLFHITNTPYGLVATMESPDQGAQRLVATASRTGSSLKLEVRQIAGTFEGTVDAARTAIEGTWSQGGARVPLILAPTGAAVRIEPRRPQNPVKPYPYRDTPTPDAEGSASARLAHWLYKPSIHDGDRDHSMPFWVEADRKDRFCVVFSSFNYSFDQYRPAKISMRKTGRLTQLICLDDRSCEVRISQTRGL